MNAALGWNGPGQERAAMTDAFQLLFNDLPAAPIRETWDEAAQDAVSAGHAEWAADGIFPKAINWSGVQAVIRRRARD